MCTWKKMRFVRAWLQSLTMQAEESIMTEKGSYWQVKTTLKEFSQAKKCSLVCAKIAKNFFPLVTSLSSHLNSIETLQSKPDNTNINFHRLLQILSYTFVLLSVLRTTSVSESLQQKHLSCVLWKSAAGLSGKTFLSAIYCSQFWWYLWN